jgi:8-oxo-dGTP pyrophosphatase MutT (NUDIX family)
LIQPSEHLRGLRARVPDARLFAPRVALALTVDGGRLLADERGDLPALEIEIESSVRATAERLLASLSVAIPRDLQLLAVHTGPAWFEQHDELGPLQPIWIVLGASAGTGTTARGLTPADPPPLAAQPMDLSATPSRLPPDYIRTVRAGIGHDRIFYPWSGLALRDESGALFLVRLAEGEQWHCPGGGMEPGETPAATAVRELAEETGLVARPRRLIGCWSAHLRAFANGDRIQGVAILLEGEVIAGPYRPDATGEIDRAGWYGADELPPLVRPWDGRVRLVMTGHGDRFD